MLMRPCLALVTQYIIRMAKALLGQSLTPAENWTAEIFFPPYLFVGGNRRAAITSLQPTGKVNFVASLSIHGKRVSLFHSKVEYRMTLNNLAKACSIDDGDLCYSTTISNNARILAFAAFDVRSLGVFSWLAGRSSPYPMVVRRLV